MRQVAPVLLAACTLDESGLAPAATVRWSGTVLVERGGEWAELEDGALAALDPADRSVVAEGERPAPATAPGWWTLEVPAGQDLALLVEGDAETAPTLWRARAPDGPAYWFEGALFALSFEAVDAQAEAAVEALGLERADPLEDGGVVHLWVQPWEPEAWAGAAVRVIGGDGAEAPAWTAAIDEFGRAVAPDERVDVVFAPNLPPGPVTLEVEAADGRALSVTWPAEGGELASGFWLALPTEEGS